ncbi:diguanylate cyclase domain-containing protein [Desulfovibrio porci]|uniref:diguanylate cyclase domain-containing protein n=1 Tax=Desulfovibrio porci TaxID=2605782 RepID=UPI003A8EB7E5
MAAEQDIEFTPLQGMPATPFRIGGDDLSCALVVCGAEKDYPLIYVNEAFLACVGYSRTEFFEKTGGYYAAVIHPEDRERARAIVDEAAPEGRAFSAEYRVMKKDGGAVWLREAGRELVAGDGRLITVSVCRDLGREVALRERLKQRGRQLQGLMDALPCGICRVTADDSLSIIYANNYFYSMLNYTPGKAAERHLHSVEAFIHPRDMKMVRSTIRENIAQGRTFFELEHRFFDSAGKVLWALIRCRLDPEEPGCLTCVLFDITSRKRMEEDLRLSEEKSRIAFRHTGKVMAVYDPVGHILFQSEEDAAVLGVPPAMPGVPESFVTNGIVAEESVESFLRFYHSMQRGIPSGETNVKLKIADRFEWFSGRYTLIFDTEGNPRRSIISYENVTEQREKELAYQKWIQFFKTQQENSIGYYEFNLTKNIYEGNERRNSGSLPEDVKSFSETMEYIFSHYIYEEDLPAYQSIFDREKLLGKFYSGQREIHFEHRRFNADGSLYWASAGIQLVPDPLTNDVKAFILIKDIDAQKKKDLELRCLLELDALTGLLNRATVVERVTEMLRRSASGMEHALIMLDLDNFKLLNDSRGHQFGDEVLKSVADSLRDVLRRHDLCGRLGGDEFVVFLPHIPAGRELEKRLEALRGATAKDYGGGLSITGSLGLARFPLDGANFDELYRKADLALYEAKRRGRDRFVIYHPDLEE